MSEPLLAGIAVVDLAGEPAAMAGRILADLGAEVVRPVEPPAATLRTLAHRFLAWGAGKASFASTAPTTHASTSSSQPADAVIDTPGSRTRSHWTPASARRGVGERHAVRPHGPHAGWRASDLGVMAASGNMHATGDPDRPPVRCSEPSGYAHAAAETAFAVLDRPRGGRPHRIDISMQEVVFVANMVAPASFPKTGHRGARRGAQHRPHPRDLALQATASSPSGCAAARRASRA